MFAGVTLKRRNAERSFSLISQMARSKITSSKFVWVHSWQIRIQSVHKYERTDHSFVADWNDTDQKWRWLKVNRPTSAKRGQFCNPFATEILSHSQVALSACLPIRHPALQCGRIVTKRQVPSSITSKPDLRLKL